MSRPTGAELEAAYNATVPDILAPGLRTVFCGINPSLYSAAVGHHFGRPGNRFWKAIHQGGFTGRLLRAEEDRELLAFGCGVTNLVARATARGDELSDAELADGGRALVRKLRRRRPTAIVFLGVTAYRAAFLQRAAQIGRQPEPLGSTAVWVLPNPSGLNAHYRMEDLADLYGDARRAIDRLWQADRQRR